MATRRVRKKQFKELAAALAAIRQEAKEKGLHKMTMREINAVIAEVRREKDPLCGQFHRISVTLSERMYRQAKAAAESEGWNLSMYVRQAIGEGLDKNSSRQPSRQRAKRPKVAAVRATKKLR